jgi:hypothetical protein
MRNFARFRLAHVGSAVFSVDAVAAPNLCILLGSSILLGAIQMARVVCVEEVRRRGLWFFFVSLYRR